MTRYADRFKTLRASKYVKDINVIFLCANLRDFERKPNPKATHQLKEAEGQSMSQQCHIRSLPFIRHTTLCFTTGSWADSAYSG